MLAYNDKLMDNIKEEISTEYADMMSKMFPELKVRNKYRDLQARANNIVDLILKKYHLVSNDKLYEVYKNCMKWNGAETMKNIFGESVMSYLAETEVEEIKTGEKPKWVRTCPTNK